MSTRAALASAIVIALVAGIAGGALALALDDGGGGSTTVTTVVRSGGGGGGGGNGGGFDPVALYAGSRNGVVTIESTFGVDDQTAGSGFVVNARRGLIATASHVVTKAQKGSPTVQASAVYIVLGDGTRVDAHVLGYDLFEDTALLQVDPKHLGLQALPLGRARSLARGRPGRRDREPVREPRLALDGRGLPARPPDRCTGRLLPDDRRRPDGRRGQSRATPAARCSTPTARSSAW